MGIDYESVICLGSNRIEIYNRLPELMRTELDDGHTATFTFESIGLVEYRFKEFEFTKWFNPYVEKDDPEYFIGFGTRLSRHHFEDRYTSMLLNLDVAYAEHKTLKIKEAFRVLGLGDPELFHFVYTW